MDLAAGVFSFADAVPEARDDFAGDALVVSGGSVEFNVFDDNGAGQDVTGVDAVTDIAALGSSIVVTSDPGKGSLAYDGFGGFTYTAAEGAFGSDSFEYTITDDDGDASTATVYLTIDAPIPTLLVDETVGQQADPKDTVSDRVSSADFSGAFASVAGATYALSVSDASGAPVPAGVGSGVFAVDRGPGAVGQGQEILLYNTAGGIEGRITNPIDGSGEWVYFTISTDDAGTITLSQSFRDPSDSYNLTMFNPDGSNPDDVVSLDGTGLYQINLTQTADGASESVDLAAGVFSFADAVPEARDDFAGDALVVSGGSVEFNVFDDNGAGQDLTGVDAVTDIAALGSSIVVTSDPGKGSLVYDGFGQFTYTAAEGAFGSDSFEYTITDDDGDASTATVYLTIDAPIPTLLVDETVGQQADPKDTVV